MFKILTFLSTIANFSCQLLPQFCHPGHILKEMRYWKTWWRNSFVHYCKSGRSVAIPVSVDWQIIDKATCKMWLQRNTSNCDGNIGRSISIAIRIDIIFGYLSKIDIDTSYKAIDMGNIGNIGKREATPMAIKIDRVLDGPQSCQPPRIGLSASTMILTPGIFLTTCDRKATNS